MAIDMRTLEGVPEEWGCSLYVIRLLATVMERAALLDSTPAPETPPWSIAVDPERERMMWWALADRTYEAQLTVEELAEVERIRPAIERHRRSRSPAPDRVPGFKFEGTDTWVVIAQECALIAERLGALDDKVLAHVLEQENESRVDNHNRLDQLTGLAGTVESAGARPQDQLSIEDVRPTLDSWIKYNRLAATRGGYEIS